MKGTVTVGDSLDEENRSEGCAVEGGGDHLVLDVDEFERKEGLLLVEEETKEDFVALPKGNLR